jgi:hypothetical protein
MTVSLVWGRETRLLTLGVTPVVREQSFSEARGIGRYVGAIPTAREQAPVSIPGRPFGAENDASERGYRRFTLERGSRVILDAPQSTFALLEITGDTETVLARYAKQLAAPDDNPAKVTLGHFPSGGTYLSFEYSPDGGGGATFSSDASRKYVTVNYSSD